MTNHISVHQARKAGLPPGTLVHIGEKKIETPRITLIDYGASQFEERQVAEIEACFDYRDSDTVTWINIDGLHEVSLIEKIGQFFRIHPLVLEDIGNTNQRPKLTDMDDYLFLVMKMISRDQESGSIQFEQVSLIIMPRMVISFQESPGDVFEGIRERIRNGLGRVRQMGSDYLAHALIDAIVDHYFVVLETLGDEIDAMEDAVMENPVPETLQRLHQIKRQLLLLRKSVWPLREVIHTLEDIESKLIHKQIRPFFRDLYDHTIQIIDMLETMRDMNAGMFDMYLSSVSNRMNEVMKVLTIIATIFIPLTFIAGVYGMNFDFMPELRWKWGYFGILSVMGTAAILMLISFKRKKWL